MNIFKVLSSGDGSIKEPNLSAFLGYLLNPKADHGLNSAFLEKFIEPFLKIDSESNPLKKLFSGIDESTDEEYVLDLSIHSRFNVEVVLEKALKRDKEDPARTGKTKEIVDIFIKITERKKKGKEDISYLFSKEEPVALILVENKINYDKDCINQLLEQYNKSLNYLKKIIVIQEDWEVWQKNICTVLISPYQEDLRTKFDGFRINKDENGNRNSIFLSWGKNNHESKNSIQHIILKLLEENNAGIIAPIPSYSIDTLRALLNFIENDFSSDADDQQRGSKGRRHIFNTFQELENSGLIKYNNITTRLISLFPSIEAKFPADDVYIQFSKSHLASFFLASSRKKILGLSNINRSVDLSKNETIKEELEVRNLKFKEEGNFYRVPLTDKVSDGDISDSDIIDLAVLLY